MYITELAPWERKNEYFNQIKINNTLENIRQGNVAQTKALLKNSNSVIASQERINEGIMNMSSGLNHIAFGLDNANETLSSIDVGILELQNTFEWGISEVILNIQESNKILKSIEQGIWHPFDAKAKNRYKQALEAYNYGWYEEAEKYFLMSEQILETDYYVHFYLGLIYMFHIIDKEKALYRFEKAYKYSLPKDEMFASNCMKHKALALFDMDKIDDAIKGLDIALELAPKSLDIYYFKSQLYAQKKNANKSIELLQLLISKSFKYLLKANADELFLQIEEELQTFNKGLRDREKKYFTEKFQIIKSVFNEFITTIEKFRDIKQVNLEPIDVSINKLKATIENMELIAKNDSLLDYKKLNNEFVNETLQFLFKLLVESRDRIKSHLNIFFNENSAELIKYNKLISRYSKKIDNYEEVISEKEDFLDETKEMLSNYSGLFLFIGGHIIPALVYLFAAPGWEKLTGLLFLIPFVSYFFTGINFYDYLNGGSDPFVKTFFWVTLLLLISPFFVYYLIRFINIIILKLNKNKLSNFYEKKYDIEALRKTSLNKLFKSFKYQFEILDLLKRKVSKKLSS